MTASASPAPPTPLSGSTLPQLSTAIRTPAYERGALRRSIVHIGVGGFHRAHLATYIDELATTGRQDWGIVGCGVLDGDAHMAAALLPQDCLYALVVRDGTTTDVAVIGSLVDYVHAAADRAAAIALIAHPDTQIVSLTITEGGYPVDDLTGHYDPNSPNAGPHSAFGLIAEGLDARRRNAGGPVTVMSCDNIMTNGRVAQAAALGEAAARSPELVEWITESVAFPNSMVDRITPATTDADRSWLAESYGLADTWPVVTEPFRQWVVEDKFAGDRLPLEELDVIVTDDVEPYEFMKLRLLNAGHSALAYLSALMGHETVDQAMNDAAIDRYLAAFLHRESKPVLPAVHGIDVDDYIATTIDRFRNPKIGDQIARLCLDGSAKFPKFLMPTVRAQLAAGGPVELSALALAGWCHYLEGKTDSGTPIQLADDPNLDAAIEQARRSVVQPRAFLDFDVVFDDDTRHAPAFRNAFEAALISLRSHGAAATITTLLDSHGLTE